MSFKKDSKSYLNYKESLFDKKFVSHRRTHSNSEFEFKDILTTNPTSSSFKAIAENKLNIPGVEQTKEALNKNTKNEGEKEIIIEDLLIPDDTKFYFGSSFKFGSTDIFASKKSKKKVEHNSLGENSIGPIPELNDGDSDSITSKNINETEKIKINEPTNSIKFSKSQLEKLKAIQCITSSPRIPNQELTDSPKFNLNEKIEKVLQNKFKDKPEKMKTLKLSPKVQEILSRLEIKKTGLVEKSNHGFRNSKKEKPSHLRKISEGNNPLCFEMKTELDQGTNILLKLKSLEQELKILKIKGFEFETAHKIISSDFDQVQRQNKSLINVRY